MLSTKLIELSSPESDSLGRKVTSVSGLGFGFLKTVVKRVKPLKTSGPWGRKPRRSSAESEAHDSAVTQVSQAPVTERRRAARLTELPWMSPSPWKTSPV